jgi:hypothetical protein
VRNYGKYRSKKYSRDSFLNDYAILDGIKGIGFRRKDGSIRLTQTREPIEDLDSLPFIKSLKPFKIWMDGMGPYPETFHPGLRLEDKWNQYQLLKSIAPMPETMILDPEDLVGIDRFLERKRKVVLKRRVGRGGRDLQVINEASEFWNWCCGNARSSPP